MNAPCSTVEYTYCSRITGVTSQIDHFILSENATYGSLDAANTFSEHFTVRCTLEFNGEYYNGIGQAKSAVTPKLGFKPLVSKVMQMLE